jgi:ABC-2 type transport system ATP-binding protein
METQCVTKVFDGRPVVNQVSLSVPEGSVFGIVGANGAGKSTLLKMMIGLFRPSFGEVFAFGKPLPRESADVRQRMHYVGADGEMYRSFRVEEMLTYARMLYDRWDEERCQTLMKALELPKKQRVRNLSLGMKMQLRLAIALATRPELLVMDEPTTGLDPIVKRQFLQLLVQEAAGTGTTVVMATHQLDDLERIADGIAVMYQGKVISTGMLQDMRSDIKQIHVVLPSGLPEALANHPSIIRSEQRGPLLSLGVEGHVQEIVHQLESAGGTHVEIQDLDVEDLFRHLMGKVGYSRDGVLLS